MIEVVGAVAGAFMMLSLVAIMAVKLAQIITNFINKGNKK